MLLLVKLNVIFMVFSLASLSSSDADTFYRALLEANMATEVGLIALDVLGLYSLHLKEQLLYKDGDNSLMRKIFDIYLSFLQVGQSEKMFKHLFAALRAFISKVVFILTLLFVLYSQFKVFRLSNFLFRQFFIK